MVQLESRLVGATELRAIAPGTPDYRRWIDMMADAYPTAGLHTVEARDAAFEQQRAWTRRTEQRLVGAFREDVFVGGMRVYEFMMCVRGVQAVTGGVGSVAVGLEWKRRGIATDLITGFLLDAQERGAALAVLYPFRLDFYKKLGFGYGAKIDQYRIALGALPRAGARNRVRRLGPRDVDAFDATYARAQARTNGLIHRERWRSAERLAADKMYTFGYDDGSRIGAYLTYEVRLAEGAINRNEMYVHELIYETPAALAGLLAFAASQSDQFATLVMSTQDPYVHFLLDDPRNGSDRTLYPPVAHETNAGGLGLMYRVVDVGAVVRELSDCRFGDLNACVRFDLSDAFFPANAGSHAIEFRSGCPSPGDAAARADVDIAIDVADLAALVMGSVRLRALVAYGRAVLSQPQWLAQLDAAFDAAPPQCLTRF